MPRLLTIIITLLFCLGVRQVEAEDSLPSDQFQQIIESQLKAFLADDGPAAYGYAAPSIQKLFPSPEIFMGMVKRQYPQVYRPKSYRFLESLTDSAGRPAQKVLIVADNGNLYVALYSLERQADGSWKIAGCTILEAATAA